MGKNAPLLTLAEVAARFNYSEEEVKGLADKGLLPHIKQERQTGVLTYLFPLDELVRKITPRPAGEAVAPLPTPRPAVRDEDDEPVTVVYPKPRPEGPQPPQPLAAKPKPAPKKKAPAKKK